jgi:hypothetical protein
VQRAQQLAEKFKITDLLFLEDGLNLAQAEKNGTLNTAARANSRLKVRRMFILRTFRGFVRRCYGQIASRGRDVSGQTRKATFQRGCEPSPERIEPFGAANQLLLFRKIALR